MAIYYTDTHESDSLNGDHGNILEYRHECQAIAEKYFKENQGDSLKIVVFDFHRNTSTIFEFTAEVHIICTSY